MLWNLDCVEERKNRNRSMTHHGHMHLVLRLLSRAYLAGHYFGCGCVVSKERRLECLKYLEQDMARWLQIGDRR